MKDKDAALEALASERRRHLVSLLLEHDEPMAMADLSKEIAKRECCDEGSPLLDDHAKDIYLTLYHLHVPKLVDLDVLTCNDDRLTVTTNPAVAEATELIEYLAEDE